MQVNRTTRYALYAALEMARQDGPVSVAQVAARYGIREAGLAKVFQQLVRAGIAVGIRGTRGGYRLARSAAALSVLDVIDAFQPPREAGGCLLSDAAGEPCGEVLCRLGQLFEEVDELTRCTFASVTLETLVGPVPGSEPAPRAAAGG